jgi:hypothetical protein
VIKVNLSALAIELATLILSQLRGGDYRKIDKETAELDVEGMESSKRH